MRSAVQKNSNLCVALCPVCRSECGLIQHGICT